MMIWQTRRKKIDVTRGGILMGILNVTPDSFSDGGRHRGLEQAVAHALEMERQGASIIDIGGESTRPGSEPVPVDDELERVLPVLRSLRDRTEALLSVDTRHPEVARQALEHGADIINDIEGLASAEMAELCAASGCGVVVMHMKGEPRTMQQQPRYENVVREVRDYFESRYADLTRRGIAAEQICWDPGIGFGKDLKHNLALIAHLSQLEVAGRPILLALSRKRTLSHILGDDALGRSPLATAVMTAYGHRSGARMHRVHDVAECAQALTLYQAVETYE